MKGFGHIRREIEAMRNEISEKNNQEKERQEKESTGKENQGIENQGIRNQEENNPRKSPQKNGLYVIKPGDSYYMGICVPDRFRKVVLSHVVSMYLDNNIQYFPPIYLAIEGRAGEGKTVQAIASCVQYGITVYYVSASELSGIYEGEASDKLKNIYNQAVDMKQFGEKNVILIDDFHMGIATVDEDVKKTINSSLLTGYLMNICQKSEEEKVPIILTGNDFSNVYAPLLRSGRAEHFFWEPEYEEKKLLVQNMLGGVQECEDSQFDEFYDRCSFASVADFAQLWNDYRKELVVSQLSQYKKLDNKAANHISRYVEENIWQLDINILIRLAKNKKMYKEIIDGYRGEGSETPGGCQC